VIHPTAVVAPRATLGTNVTIGPYAIIGPEVTLGDEVEIAPHAVLEGRVELGPRVRVGSGAVIGGEPQDLKFKRGTPSGVRVGAGTVIREYATVHRATHAETWTEIGADCLIMGSAHVAHDCRVGDHVVMINFAGLTGHCEVGDRATIGGLTGIAPFTRIGTFAYIGGLAKVTRDCPPFMIADGHPATVRGVNVIGLRRAGVGPAERRALRDAYRVLYRLGLAPGAALDRLRREAPPVSQIKELVAFLETARRGTLGPPGSEEPLVTEEEDD
jgi:UDP-N-acetylglucosamine acyltransferase